MLLAASLTQGCLSTKPAALAPAPAAVVGEPNQRQVNDILRTAFSQIGNPYRYGGAAPETGFDCSGFVGWVYQQFGVELPRSSRAMLAVGDPVAREDLRPGDLVFFNYGYSHVGIYTGDDKYIHSPRTGKRIQESDLNATGRGDRFVGGRRIIDNRGVTAISEILKAEWIAQSRHLAGAGSAAAAAAAGVSGGRAAAASGTAAAAPRIHKVVRGDTLIHLARRYGVHVRDIVAANSLPDRHKLAVGQRLRIPQKPASRTASNKPRTAAKPAAPKPAPPPAAKPSS
jgi:hypothetical protein